MSSSVSRHMLWHDSDANLGTELHSGTFRWCFEFFSGPNRPLTKRTGMGACHNYGSVHPAIMVWFRYMGALWTPGHLITLTCVSNAEWAENGILWMPQLLIFIYMYVSVFKQYTPFACETQCWAAVYCINYFLHSIHRHNNILLILAGTWCN